MEILGTSQLATHRMSLREEGFFVEQEISKHWCVWRAAAVEYVKQVMFGLRKAKQM